MTSLPPLCPPDHCCLTAGACAMEFFSDIGLGIGHALSAWWGAYFVGLASFPMFVIFGTFFFFLHLELAERRMAKKAKVQQMKEALLYKSGEN